VISVEEALDRILSRVSVLGDERVPLARALGRVLEEVVDSTLDMPPCPASWMDG
jgi:molybdopterin biosynthesis enzyme